MVRRATARPVRAIRGDPVVADGWPWDVPAVRQFLTDGLEPGAVTILVGENGSGKSTLVEAIAVAYGLSAEGGSTGARHTTRPTESPLHERLSLVRNPGSARWCILRSRRAAVPLLSEPPFRSVVSRPTGMGMSPGAPARRPCVR